MANFNISLEDCFPDTLRSMQNDNLNVVKNFVIEHKIFSATDCECTLRNTRYHKCRFIRCTFLYFSDYQLRKLFSFCTFEDCKFEYCKISLTDWSAKFKGNTDFVDSYIHCLTNTEAFSNVLSVCMNNSEIDIDDTGPNQNLIGADKFEHRYACPRYGGFVAYKKVRSCNSCSFLGHVVATLWIPEDAKRSSAFGNKCRADKAVVMKLERLELVDDGYKGETYAKGPFNFKLVDISNSSSYKCLSIFDEATEYKVGETIMPDSFDDRWYMECSNGIHFFYLKEDAIFYGM